MILVLINNLINIILFQVKAHCSQYPNREKQIKFVSLKLSNETVEMHCQSDSFCIQVVQTNFPI